MKKSSVIIIVTRVMTAVALAVGFSACSGGGGGSVSTGGVSFTHEQLAQEFVDRAYVDAGYVLTLVKVDTLQTGYIVVEDSYGLEAVYIDGWSPGMDISTYMSNETWWGVSYIGGGDYQDIDGFIYEETQAQGKDVGLAAAVKRARDIQASADNIHAQFGLSEDRSLQLAQLAVEMKYNSKSLTAADLDGYSKEIIGKTVGEINTALTQKAQGNDAGVDDLIKSAVAVNNLSGPEQAQGIISMITGQSFSK